MAYTKEIRSMSIKTESASLGPDFSVEVLHSIQHLVCSVLRRVPKIPSDMELYSYIILHNVCMVVQSPTSYSDSLWCDSMHFHIVQPYGWDPLGLRLHARVCARCLQYLVACGGEVLRHLAQCLLSGCAMVFMVSNILENRLHCSKAMQHTTRMCGGPRVLQP